MAFNRDVALPSGLELSAIRKAIRYIESELGDQHFIDLYLEQANIFSALVSMFGTKALDSVSNYEKHKHSDTSQQRFPDLRRRGSPFPTPPADALESKGSKRPWSIQSHYNHEGWYIVWRYLVDLTATIEPGRKLVVWRVDVVYLREDDWEVRIQPSAIRERWKDSHIRREASGDQVGRLCGIQASRHHHTTGKAGPDQRRIMKRKPKPRTVELVKSTYRPTKAEKEEEQSGHSWRDHIRAGGESGPGRDGSGECPVD